MGDAGVTHSPDVGVDGGSDADLIARDEGNSPGVVCLRSISIESVLAIGSIVEGLGLSHVLSTSAVGNLRQALSTRIYGII